MLDDIRTQLRVIGALTIHELQGMFRAYNYGFAWALFEPIMYVAVLRVARSYLKQLQAPNMGPITFLLLGIIPFFTFNSAMGAGLNAVGRSTGMLAVPRVTPVDLAVAAALSEFCIFITMFTALIVPVSIFERSWPPENPLGVLAAFIGIWSLGLSLGLVIGSASRVFPPVREFVSYLNRGNRMVGGLFFVITMIPSALWPLLTWNPILHFLEFMRDEWFATYTSPVASVTYVLEWLIGFYLLGLSLERFFRRVPYV